MKSLEPARRLPTVEARKKTRRFFGLYKAGSNTRLPDRTAAELWILRNQLSRRNVAPYTRAVIVSSIEEREAAKAKERQRDAGKHGKKGGRGKKKKETLRPNSDEGFSGRTDANTSKAAGMGRDTYRKAKQIREWKPDPETEGKLEVEP